MTPTSRTKSRARSARPQEPDQEQFEDQEEFDDEGQDEPRGGRDSGGGVISQLKDEAADAALAVLAPVAKSAATKAAKYAVKKGPQLVEETVLPKLEEAGGAKGLMGSVMSSDGPAKGLMSKVTGGLTGGGGGGGNAGDGTGKGRRMPVQQAVDVAAPIDIVYDQFTQFEDFPKFMHRVQSAEQRDDATVAFHAKVWGFKRQWEAEIIEQRPDERIVWKSNSGLQLTGVVTFHELAERLTRIELNIDVAPSGPIEKIARGTRVIKRAARADLKRFKAYVEMHEDETGAWRGEIQDGEVVSGPEDEPYEDEYEDEEGAEPEEEADEPVAEDEEYEDDEGAEDEEEADEPVAEDEAEDEEEKAPARPKSRSRSSSSGRGQSRAKSSSSRSRGSNGGDPKSSRSSSRRKSSSSRSSNGGSGSKSRSSSRSKATSGKRSS